MNLTNLKILARAYVPQAKLQAINDATLVIILNEGCLDVGLKASVLKTSASFNAVSGTQEYDLRTALTRYLAIDKGGVWYLSGTTYKKLYPKTIEWLDENVQNWRNGAAGEPLYYYLYSDKIGFYPKPSSSVTNGFLMYFVQRPTPMANATPATEYPFNGASEIDQYAPYSDCVLDYWIWRARRILSFPEQEVIAAKNQYMQNMLERVNQINRRVDIAYDRSAKLQGVKIP
jgi:hypothetical protein